MFISKLVRIDSKLLWLILLLAVSWYAASIRLTAFDFDLPYQLNPDEPYYQILGRFFREGRGFQDIGGAGYPPGYPHRGWPLQACTGVS